MQHNFFSGLIKCNNFFFPENTSGRRGIPSLTPKSIKIDEVQDKGNKPKLSEANKHQKTLIAKRKIEEDPKSYCYNVKK